MKKSKAQIEAKKEEMKKEATEERLQSFRARLEAAKSICGRSILKGRFYR